MCATEPGTDSANLQLVFAQNCKAVLKTNPLTSQFFVVSLLPAEKDACANVIGINNININLIINVITFIIIHKLENHCIMLLSLRSSMDRTRVCGTRNAGSIPAGEAVVIYIL